MQKLIPLLAYAASVFLTWKNCGEYWIAGPVFGAAVLLANFPTIRKKISLNHLLFVVASTLVYALVFWMADKGWRFQQEWLDMFAGGLSAGVIVGSLLMPFVHVILLKGDLKTARSVALLLIASWYAVLFFSWVDETFNFKLHINYLLISIALWQGIYLHRLKVK